MRSEDIVRTLLSSADVAVNGARPWDITVQNEGFYKRALGGGNLGLGESYMDGWWECGRLDEFIFRILRSGMADKARKNVRFVLHVLGALILNQGRKSKAFEIGERHYDIGNDLYERMLDGRMVYSCGYWKKAKTLAEAQRAKLELICEKLGLKPGMRILDIGCGWGSFVKYAAERYGAEAVGVTVSKEQADKAKEMTRGLPVEIRLQDYRSLNGVFDRVVSVGMFEHVGYKNYRTFLRVVRRSLTDDGLFLLHTIGRTTSAVSADPWIHKYIFPNGMLPSIKQIGKAAEKLFVMEDWHSFGADYDKTLMAWFANFDKHWMELKERYGDRFYRMWKYYLLSCAGAFRARQLQLWQIVLSPRGIAGGYQSVR